MRQLKDAAALERAADSIKRAAENPLKSVPGEPVRFVRGARVRDQLPTK